MKKTLAVVGALALSATACDKPAPAEVTPIEVVEPARAINEAEAGVLASFLDALDRIAPALHEESGAAAMQQQLSDVVALISSGRVKTAQSYAIKLREMITELQRAGADAAELDVVRLAIEGLEQITPDK